MRGTAGLLPARNIFKQIYPVRGTIWVATSTPEKQTSSETGGGQKIMDEKADPIVAFSKPPPLPPVLGPLVALSLLETWVNRDSNDD